MKDFIKETKGRGDDTAAVAVEKVSVDVFLDASMLVRRHSPYLAHGFKAWMRGEKPDFLTRQHPMTEWEQFYTDYVKS